MKTSLVVKIVIVFLLSACFGVVFLFFDIFNNGPRDALKYALKIKDIPEIVEIFEAHDNWTDSVSSIYLKINPKDFDQVMSGLNYEKTEFDLPMEMNAMWVVPKRSINYKNLYRYSTNVYSVKVYVSADKSELIIISSHD